MIMKSWTRLWRVYFKMNREVLERIIQTIITIEELGELSQALSKYTRYMCSDKTIRVDIYQITDMVFEELADVELCLEKFKELNYIDQQEIDRIKQYKEKRLK